MKKVSKIAFWCVGALLLLFILRLPVQDIADAWESWSMPLSGKTIVIDPGHGGPDGGAVGGQDVFEKDIALATAKKLQRYFQQTGALVYLTREKDTDLAGEDVKGLAARKSQDIRNRLAFIEEKEPDLFVTIHLNALSSSQWRGAQTFYYPSFDENKHLATMIQNEIIRNLENTNRTPLAINGIYLLKHAPVPGALVEIGFLSNQEELELLKDENYQEQMAASIYEGVLRYVTEEPEEDE